MARRSHQYYRYPFSLDQTSKVLDECLMTILVTIYAYRYFAQILKLATKFPFDEDNLKVTFTWSNFQGKDMKPGTSFLWLILYHLTLNLYFCSFKL